MFRQHGLVSEAKKELIEVIFNNQDAKNKAEAYYILGTLAFEEKNLSVALETWSQLFEAFPESEHTKLVKDRIKQLSEIVSEVSRTNVENATAQSYLRHAEFWSKGKREVFNIDSSWIPKVETAVSWYDKVIQGFPKTAASKRAYEGKMLTLIGWEDPGRYGDSYGIQKNFNKYMPQLRDTFSAFERDFPEASSLQAFRYQIAQGYWGQRDWDNAKIWLNVIMGRSGDRNTFYHDLAERRLKKLKY
jgi:TolA-binding protein